MKLLEINTSDAGGGAEKVSLNLHRVFKKRGHSASLAVGAKKTEEAGVVLLDNERYRNAWARWWRGCGRKLARANEEAIGTRSWARSVLYRIGEPQRWIDITRGHEDFAFPGTRHLLELIAEKPDIIVCHNLHGGYFDLTLLPWLSRQAPTVLVLHDAWLLGGHCAHPLDCIKWKTGCEKCPNTDLFPAIKKDSASYNWKRKRDILADCRIHVAAPCEWLINKTKTSILTPAIIDVRVIPNGINLSLFDSKKTKNPRESLSIPDDATVFLFAGKSVKNNAWKDFETLRAAIAHLGTDERSGEAVTICLGDDGASQRFGNVEIRYVPYTNDETIVAKYFRAADVYLHAARVDTFPTTVIEAFASGLPVIATRVGGIPEQIDDGVEGFLVEPGDPVSFAQRMKLLVEDGVRREAMGQKAREKARILYDVEDQADKYLSWFDGILSHDSVIHHLQ